MGIKAGNLPTSTIDSTDYVMITEGEAPKRVLYSDVKNNILGTETLTTTSQTVKGAINENTALLSDKVNKTSIVNNLLATVAGSVADATQVKILNDKISGKVYESGGKSLTFSSATLLTATVTLTKITSGIAICSIAETASTPIASTNILSASVLNGVLTINAYGTGYVSGHILGVNYIVISN